MNILKDFTFVHQKVLLKLNEKIRILYKKIFKEEVSFEVNKFISSLFSLTIGTLIATVFSFSFSILAGRYLGPSEYGKFALIKSVAMFLFIPFFMGISTSMIKYCSDKNDFSAQKKLISTSYILVFIFALFWSALYVIFSKEISNLFSIQLELYYLAILFALVYSFDTLTTNTQRSLHLMKDIARITPIKEGLLLLFFIFCIYSNIYSYKAMFYPMVLAFLIASMYIVYRLRKYISLDFDKNWSRILIGYGSLSVLGGISNAIYVNIDKIFINKYLSITDVGVYNAYTYGSINLVILFSGIFLTTFFPTACKYKNKKPIFKKVNKMVYFIIILGIPGISLFQYFILKLYGNEYPIDIYLIILFSIGSILLTIYRIYAWLFNSEGTTGLKVTLRGTIAIAITNIFLNMYLIPRFRLYGAIEATCLAFLIGLIIILTRKNVLMDEL